MGTRACKCVHRNRGIICVPTCPPGVLIIWLWFYVRFQFLLLMTHIHPPVPHYLLLVKYTIDARRHNMSIGIQVKNCWDVSRFRVCCVVYVSIQCTYLEAASFGGVQDEELLEQVLTVSGHVEGNSIFSTKNALSQFLEMNERGKSQILQRILSPAAEGLVMWWFCLLNFI